jgi:hypothetical protein
MALRRPNLPSFATNTTQLSDVDKTSSPRTEPTFFSDVRDHAQNSTLPLSSPNGDRVEMSADHEDCSAASGLNSAAGHLNQAMAAMTVYEDRDSSSTDLHHDIDAGGESRWKIAESSNIDIESVDQPSARTRVKPCLRSPNSQANTSRSPARTSSSRPYSLVEERAKRFSREPSETRAINNGAVTLPTPKRPSGHSMGYDAATIHATTAVSRHVAEDRPNPAVNPLELVDTGTDRNSDESLWLKKIASQAPPPAEIWSPPSVPVSAVDVLPGIFDGHAVLFEQSVRVEPSPERILGPVISQEEEIQAVSTSAS